MTIPAPTIKDWPLRTTMPVNSLVAIVEPSSGDTSKFVFAKIAGSHVPGNVAFTIDFSQGAVVANGTIIPIRKSPYPFTITSLDYEVGSAAGSFTVAIQINGTNVTGLSAVAVSSATTANAVATALNTVATGDKVSAVITGVTGSPTGANLQLNGTR
jgi:hypothetical protein